MDHHLVIYNNMMELVGGKHRVGVSRPGTVQDYTGPLCPLVRFIGNKFNAKG